MIACWLVFGVLSGSLSAQQVCVSCHPKEIAGYSKSGMARSISLPISVTEASFVHNQSGTAFAVKNSAGGGVVQAFHRGEWSGSFQIAYVIGSGNHAQGALVRLGDHLFQSPLSWYTTKQVWDVAPGYEQDPAPDFSRPITVECLNCHSGGARPLPNSVNSFESPPFTQATISCDRCHGPADAHLRNPVRGSIVNPAHLTGAVRDSVCEQCHLAGEARVPNRGKSLADYHPGMPAEEVYTTFVLPTRTSDGSVKVISHSEQLALSRCARASEGKLWCGTCHNPHDKPTAAESASYYRERCLTCHATTLSRDHAAPDRNCVACHMPQRPAKDGGHTAFTDHRISRLPDAPAEFALETLLRPWRVSSDGDTAQRNLAIALVTHGLEKPDSAEAIEGFRMLNRMGGKIAADAPALTALGSILLTAKQPAEAVKRYAAALALRPGYAPYEVNLASALAFAGDLPAAITHAESAVKCDNLLAQAVQLLDRLYRQNGQTKEADALMSRYRAAQSMVVEHR